MSKLIEWNPDYQLHVKIVDEQHKKLIDIINLLHDAMSNRHTKEELPQILDNLTDYALIHFRTEEELMKRHHYQAEKDHHQEHDDFAKKVLEWKAKFAENRTISIDMAYFLKDWLHKHILGTDKNMALFLQQKGIK